MDAPHTSPIHFYDTTRHLILCGVPGFADRSTKHERAVTCPSCIELLADRRSSRHIEPEADSVVA